MDFQCTPGHAAWLRNIRRLSFRLRARRFAGYTGQNSMVKFPWEESGPSCGTGLLTIWKALHCPFDFVASGAVSKIGGCKRVNHLEFPTSQQHTGSPFCFVCSFFVVCFFCFFPGQLVSFYACLKACEKTWVFEQTNTDMSGPHCSRSWAVLTQGLLLFLHFLENLRRSASLGIGIPSRGVWWHPFRIWPSFNEETTVETQGTCSFIAALLASDKHIVMSLLVFIWMLGMS